MSESKTPKQPKSQDPAVSRARRRLYIKERLPAVASEMKTLGEERKEILAKRKDAKPEERKELNRRWNFIVERLEVLRSERASLMGERDGVPSQRSHAEPPEEGE